jgi:hypothetical protein
MSKFDAIRDLLRDQTGVVEMPFDDLSNVIRGGLPKSAYDWNIWWSNDDSTHSQSRSWGDAGYRAEPDLTRKTVRFVPGRK